ncbi:hypothetical protein Misp01_03320 [Microtetraspora sp. NBRC 13810]|uniref:antibiotic biosynthesis monooxygenase family protein n=1 Tax=Microtetraspora sp. NBRC 13810 TaxID=3030990 RepID=UPI0024A0636A|nr:antibiotic biosynthesis monooxygenase family protein [Microtetraspora sp. NBRC 13810]GLW05202.1 hypothetical protein Misp01_03320 [Microtetraspora sp. NBRC 13810]
MIVEYVRYRVPDAETFEAAYRRAVVPLGKAPQCLDYELSRCVDEPECYIPGCSPTISAGGSARTSAAAGRPC